MSDKLLRGAAKSGRRRQFCLRRSHDGSIEGQAVLLMHSDMQQSTSVVSGGAGVSLLATALCLEIVAQLQDMLVREACSARTIHQQVKEVST